MKIGKENIDFNQDFETALSFINETDRHVFLTGKAGTGKTTFLKYLKETTFKKMAVVAPTGIAAVSASGVTIHSLFNLPIVPFFPGVSEIRNTLNSEKRTLLRQLELLVIDEVSMLRADLLDALDVVLRETRRIQEHPFGGLQILFIGDLYQLSPIASSSEWTLLKKYYTSPFFTSAKVFSEVHPVYINLEKIYRQNDANFISLLNAVREGQCSQDQIELLNKHWKPGIQSQDGYITLSTHNDTVDSINTRKLTGVTGNLLISTAEIHGEFDEASYPTEKILQLKEGAQVMLLRNDSSPAKRFYNGKIGILRKIETERLHIELDEGAVVEIEKELWTNIKYEYDTTSGKIQEREIGSFQQYPVKLAWAITVHKSQGLTFDKTILDIQNVFAPGQAYVALSRIRSLEGLILTSPITLELLNNNASSPEEFPSYEKKVLNEILLTERKLYIKKIIHQKLDWTDVINYVEDNSSDVPGYNIMELVYEKIASYKEVIEKFNREVNTLFESKESEGYSALNNRLKAACSYFIKEIDILVGDVLSNEYKRTKDSITQKLNFRFIKGCLSVLKVKRNELEVLMTIVTGLVESKTLSEILLPNPKSRQPAKQAIQKQEKKNEIAHDQKDVRLVVFEYFQSGDSINIISQKVNLSSATIENYLADFVLNGQLDIFDLIEESKLKQIISILDADKSTSIFSIKQQVGGELSFGQIKAALNYYASQRPNA